MFTKEQQAKTQSTGILQGLLSSDYEVLVPSFRPHRAADSPELVLWRAG